MATIEDESPRNHSGSLFCRWMKFPNPQPPPPPEPWDTWPTSATETRAAAEKIDDYWERGSERLGNSRKTRAVPIRLG